MHVMFFSFNSWMSVRMFSEQKSKIRDSENDHCADERINFFGITDYFLGARMEDTLSN